MSEINEFVDKAKNIANMFGKKTGEVVESSKLRLQIISLNSEISTAYEELGSIVYHAAKKNASCGEAVEEKMDQIDELLEKLRKMEGKVAEIKKVRKCQNCGAVCPADAHFCSRCGMILSTMIPEECESGGDCDGDCCKVPEQDDCCENSCQEPEEHSGEDEE